MSDASHRFDNAKRRRTDEHDRQAMATPPYVLEPIRSLLGGIGLDPCTDPDNPTGAIKQVRANYELGKYICGTARRMLNNPIVNIQYRGLIFSSKTFKGTTKPKKTLYHQDINSELKFRHLQSGNNYSLDTLSD